MEFRRVLFRSYALMVTSLRITTTTCPFARRYSSSVTLSCFANSCIQPMLIPHSAQPLAIFTEEDLDYEYGYVLKIDGSQCAVPCPSIVFDLDDLDAAWQYTYVLNIISVDRKSTRLNSSH